ncbi:MAG: cation:proton antiporter [Bacteroidota bacterium]
MSSTPDSALSSSDPMSQLSHYDLVVLLLSISVLLLFSRVLSEFGRKIGLPVLIGEIIVGILLGPTLLGRVIPDLSIQLFPQEGPVALALDAIFKLSVVLLLFVAGMEVQLPVVLRQGRLATFTSITSMVLPFMLGFWITWHFPALLHWDGKGSLLIFSLFFGTALSISALPVIARILMDLGIYRTKIGMLIIASAMFNDLLGWLVFSVVLAMMENRGVGTDIGWTIFYVIGFGLFMLTIGRKVLSQLVPWMQNKLSWPGGILSVSLGLCFFCAAFTEAIGIHSILGGFIMGIALGDCVELKEKAREIIHQFITNIFAPLFFVSIGLYINMVDNFNLQLVLIVLLLATFGKLVGATLGAYMGGLDFRSASVVGFGMNARGAMEIVLSTLAFKAGIIGNQLFVALIIMALVTSILAGPVMRRLLKMSPTEAL